MNFHLSLNGRLYSDAAMLEWTALGFQFIEDRHRPGWWRPTGNRVAYEIQTLDMLLSYLDNRGCPATLFRDHDHKGWVIYFKPE